MIVGTGVDLVEISRIRKLIERFEASFTNKVFTVNEQHEARLRRVPAIYYAGRWAAKEAVSKALGCGIGAQCAWLDIEVCNTPVGRPEVTLSGAALETMRRLGAKSVHLSVSHEASYAIASVILEK